MWNLHVLPVHWFPPTVPKLHVQATWRVYIDLSVRVNGLSWCGLWWTGDLWFACLSQRYVCWMSTSVEPSWPHGLVQSTVSSQSLFWQLLCLIEKTNGDHQHHIHTGVFFSIQNMLPTLCNIRDQETQRSITKVPWKSADLPNFVITYIHKSSPGEGGAAGFQVRSRSQLCYS